ncbi:enoyl-CoA hydratase/isomerase family protein [Paenisporosarcina antarctica]|uniref:Ethylmalonyl-CoA decarboxylase n=1 Tax=Paenisporosarcina antarctica TaxID=417367 RepID=A0A4P6ZZ90_9BACL|nr:enoyl-CoA hydratase/isomerase family protein [Paenisporosarcina antarctica]QBP41558.1 enoyl-CoA hydratase/isomerase family protein [Paenisporosarcina antarctica]
MTFTINREENILRFTINRPKVRNAINHEVIAGFESLVTSVHNDSTIQFVVITGEGNEAFCSGGDLSIFHGLQTEEDAFPMLNRMATALYNIATLPVPVIALVNGHAVGGGCEIATACDFRLVSSHAKAGFIQGTLAITSGWGGGTYLFEKLARQDIAMQMLCEAKPLLAHSLLDNGWATQLYDGNKEQALETFVHEMKQVEASVHRAYKQMLIRKWTEQKLLEQIKEEVKTCSKLWAADEHHEAVQKFLKKRK